MRTAQFRPAARPRPPGRVATLLAALALSLVSVLTSTGQAQAAAPLERVTSFGSNPGNLAMYRYVPPGLAPGSPVVVLLHGCGQNAQQYTDGSGWQKFADAGGFALVAAEQQTGNNISRCFNWFQPGDTARGAGEALSVRQMVDHTVGSLGSDPGRVYVTGLSAGGAMTGSLLAAYPDVFAGGAIVAGIPHGCATSMVDAFSCMFPGRTATAASWGDRVRAAYPGYTGPRPSVSLWHGGADYVVATANLQESVKQWTQVVGGDQQADATSQLPANTTRSVYNGAAGAPPVVGYLTPGNGHGTPVAPGSGPDQCGTAGAYFLASLCSSYHIARDWGLTG
ncbi:alpha/beta hydrolase family esterase [Streptomyces sp. SBT349]|uniref:extracellular catalytic domain type 1 short-chain-length polyhydroxyalkanoate depolymerase n=1 Tax=Streptomyces sp. SBT349 TaxID=1580539 RepID=UPI00066B978D|nr:PHB depolymerase family esterase [Streptomyces sp. SBT349]